MNKYLVLIVFVFSILISKIYLETQKENDSKTKIKLSYIGETLISENLLMKDRYPDPEDYDDVDITSEEELEKEKKIQKQEDPDELNKDDKEREDTDNGVWWIFWE